jgi:glycosyltransferase involved in cell wall biosynthesis
MRLARYLPVLYVDPLGNRAIALRDLGRVVQRLVFRLGRRGPPAAGAVTVHAPLVYLPWPDNGVAHRINTRLLTRALRDWMRGQGVDTLVAWAGTPSLAVADAIAALRPRLTVYDCIDDVALFHRRPEAVARAERRLAEAADVVVATAELLDARMRQLNPRTVLIPNGADVAHFARALDTDLPVPPDVAALAGPVLGYVGGLAQWFDFDLVHRLATSNAGWHVVIVGPVQRGLVETWRIRQLPNVHYLGRRDYATLPAYLARFDVCLIPFKVDAITAAVSPVKLFEYLAAGKPVVSTPLAEVARYGEVVTLAPAAEFPRAVAGALATARDPAAVERRLRVARDNAWDVRVAAILDVFREAGIVVDEKAVRDP